MFNANSKRYEYIERILSELSVGYFLSIDYQEPGWSASIFSVEIKTFAQLSATAPSINHAMQELNSMCLDYLDD